MRALLLVLPLLLAFVAGQVQARWADRRARQQQKWQLDLYRATHEDVIRLCMQHMDVEPFARLVWDEINTPTLKGK